MRHLKKKNNLNLNPAARKALLRNLATNLVLYEKIITTKARAKAVKSFTERLITTGKVDNLANRRKLLKVFFVKKAVNKVIDILGPRYKDRKGGYTRIIKLDSRKGDGAEMVQIEFIKPEVKE